MKKTVLTALLFLFLGSFEACPALSADDIIGRIKLPPGFKIEVYAEVQDARSLAQGPDGFVFVGNRGRNNVYAVINRPYGSKRIVKVAENLSMPNGIAYKDGELFIAANSRIYVLRGMDKIPSGPVKPEIIYDGLPSETWHGWRYLGFGPDGLLYVSVGVACNLCKPEKAVFGTICRLKTDGKGFEIYASGIRNSVGFDWDPESKALYFTENGRDFMGDNLPPDKLDRADKPGMNFGFPYFSGKNLPEKEFAGQAPKNMNYTPPLLELQAHVAPLGMRFYTGGMFPPEYKNSIFIAEHGSWNRSVPIGYRIINVNFRSGKPEEKIFADGWLNDDGSFIGRPVDVIVMPDGALLASDDYSGLVYRITYKE